MKNWSTRPRWKDRRRPTRTNQRPGQADRPASGLPSGGLKLIVHRPFREHRANVQTSWSNVCALLSSNMMELFGNSNAEGVQGQKFIQGGSVCRLGGFVDCFSALVRSRSRLPIATCAFSNATLYEDAHTDKDHCSVCRPLSFLPSFLSSVILPAAVLTFAAGF